VVLLSEVDRELQVPASRYACLVWVADGSLFATQWLLRLAHAEGSTRELGNIGFLIIIATMEVTALTALLVSPKGFVSKRRQGRKETNATCLLLNFRWRPKVEFYKRVTTKG